MCSSGLYGTTYNTLLNLLYMIYEKSGFNSLHFTFLMSYSETVTLMTPDDDPSRIKT